MPVPLLPQASCFEGLERRTDQFRDFLWHRVDPSSEEIHERGEE